MMSTVSNARQAASPSDDLGGTLPARIHALLEQAIIEGVVEPGTRLSADKIASQYGVSRIPVREALSSLHEAGWVDIRPRLGVYVRERSLTELSQLVEARSVIEAAITEQAATRGTPEALDAVDRAVRASKEAAARKDVGGLSAHSSQFYAALRTAGGNTVLASVSADLEKRARFYFGMVAGDLGADWVATHDRIATLIRNREARQASLLIRQHILDTGEAVAHHLGG